MRVRARVGLCMPAFVCARACLYMRAFVYAQMSVFCRSLGKHLPACVCVGVRGCVSACGRTVCMRLVAVSALWWHGGDRRYQ